jgi:ribosomal protein S18 acetylase RimI-like enzyme
LIAPASLPDHLFVASPLPLAGLRFRLATAADRTALHQQCHTQYGAQDFARQFERSLQRQVNGRGYHLVALLDPSSLETSPASILVGSGQLILHPRGAEVAELAVTPAYRSLGIGTALINVLTGIARHLGVTSLEIGVMSTNERALALYRRLGFEEDRQMRVAFASDPALILVKDLSAWPAVNK